jgi:hypothetical protein
MQYCGAARTWQAETSLQQTRRMLLAPPGRLEIARANAIWNRRDSEPQTEKS